MKFTSLLRFATVVAWRRTLADWRLQLAAGFGMVLAVALLAAGVIYAQALEETALRYTLRNAVEEDIDVTVRVFHGLELPSFSSTRNFLEERVEKPLSQHLEDTLLLIQTSTLYPKNHLDHDTTAANQPRTTLQAITGLVERTELLEGRYPTSKVNELEVLVDLQGALLLDLSVGQTLDLFSAVTEDKTLTVPVRIVGIFEPKNATSKFWDIGTRDRLSVQTQNWVNLPLYTNTLDLVTVAEKAIPHLISDFVWHFDVDQDGIRASKARSLRTTVENITDDIQFNLQNSSWDTNLGAVLKQYEALLVVARIPLFLLLFLAVAVLVYYLLLIAGLLGRLRAQEVAIFRSRGASTWQVGLVILIEGLIMALPAIVAGPFLAQLLVTATGRLFPGAANSPSLDFVDLSTSAVLLGAMGAALAVVVLTTTTLVSARHGMVVFRSTSARPPSAPFFLRYYLDLGLLIVIAVLWWQLKSRGSFLIKPVSGGDVSIDITLLLGPVLGVLAAGLLLLRIFPIVLRIVSRFVDPLGSVWLIQALRKIGRDPIPAGSIMVLITLATALGVLSSAILSTLEKSQEDQASYEAGADLRIQHDASGMVASGQSPASQLATLPGINAASDVFRLGTRASTKSFGEDVMLLGVDSDALQNVAWTRSDLSNGSLDQMLDLLKSEALDTQGITLPHDTTALGIWVMPGRISRSPYLFGRLQDNHGIYFDMMFGELKGTDWYYMEAPVLPVQLSRSRRAPPPPVVEPPYTLHALWFASPRRGSTIGTVFMDQLMAITPREGQDVFRFEVESFQSVDNWHPLEDPMAEGFYSLDISESVTRNHRKSAVFQWGRGGNSTRGIRAGSPQNSLPTVVSANFLSDSNMEIGDEFSVSLGDIHAPLRIVGVTPYFPTLYPDEMPFMLVELEPALDYIALHDVRPSYPSTEIWAKTDGSGISPEVISATLGANAPPDITQASKLVAERVSDPLLTAGWSGLMALSFIAVVLASASGLLLYTYIDTREHVGEFAILRTLGFTTIQVNAVVWFNLTLTVVLGMLLGTWGGQILGSAILPLLEVAEGGQAVTPPMALQTNWTALIIAYALFVATTLVTIVALAWAISKLEVQKILRVAEA